MDLAFLLTGWPSYLLYLGLFSLVLKEYFHSLVLAHWEERERALGYRRGERVFGALAGGGLLSYGLVLWLFGVASRDKITCLSGLSLLTLIILQASLTRRYFLYCLLAYLLFVLYGYLLLSLPVGWEWV